MFAKYKMEQTKAKKLTVLKADINNLENKKEK